MSLATRSGGSPSVHRQHPKKKAMASPLKMTCLPIRNGQLRFRKRALHELLAVSTENSRLRAILSKTSGKVLTNRERTQRQGKTFLFQILKEGTQRPLQVLPFQKRKCPSMTGVSLSIRQTDLYTLPVPPNLPLSCSRITQDSLQAENGKRMYPKHTVRIGFRTPSKIHEQYLRRKYDAFPQWKDLRHSRTGEGYAFPDGWAFSLSNRCAGQRESRTESGSCLQASRSGFPPCLKTNLWPFLLERGF